MSQRIPTTDHLDDLDLAIGHLEQACATLRSVGAKTVLGTLRPALKLARQERLNLRRTLREQDSVLFDEIALRLAFARTLQFRGEFSELRTILTDETTKGLLLDAGIGLEE